MPAAWRRKRTLPLLVEMMQLLGGDYRLILVGSGIERERLEHLIAARAPGLVCFLDHITDREELAEVYASCDLFVHPNPREPFGIAPLEAMASGLPLVGPNCGGLTSFANDANAWLANPDAPSFAAAVRQAVQQDSARLEKMRAGLATAAEHSWDRAALAYFALYDSIYAEFWGLDAPVRYPAYAWSTQAINGSEAVITASSIFAQTVARAMLR